MKDYRYAAFSGYGIELEYAIVDVETLQIRPIADTLLMGAQDMDVPRGDDAAWSNELALHVIETKTAGPIEDLSRARDIFRREVNAINEQLSAQNAQLIPTGMHPWMNPEIETKLWPHQNNEIYEAFDKIFDCRGHGWSNLQSMHINFPFKNEEEFGRLHAACRIVLPLLPAIAASSPFWEGKRAPHLDQRLAVYRNNCVVVPAVTGQVIPEAVFSYADYQALLSGIYRAIAPFDPGKILQEEWLNARGAIARFDRGAIEIRVIDTQECPEQDLAVAFFTTQLVKALAQGELSSFELQCAADTQALADLFDQAILLGQSCPIGSNFAELFQTDSSTLGELYRSLLERLVPHSSIHHAALSLIAEHGSLSERLVTRLGGADPTSSMLHSIYAKLCDCLRNGQAYIPCKTS